MQSIFRKPSDSSGESSEDDSINSGSALVGRTGKGKETESEDVRSVSKSSTKPTHRNSKLEASSVGDVSQNDVGPLTRLAPNNIDPRQHSA
jgi:hypothetical protein